ncbi:MAG: hypothetical protein V4731_06625 [Pseudomonadota bacterium]
MENIIVYVDDTAYARQLLQSMTAEGEASPTRWILLGCAPRMTHHASKWVTQRARESWRGKWAEKTFPELVPLLQKEGDHVMTRLAKPVLASQTQELIKELGTARVLDARRPKFGESLVPVCGTQEQEHKAAVGVFPALASAGLLVAND